MEIQIYHRSAMWECDVDGAILAATELETLLGILERLEPDASVVIM